MLISGFELRLHSLRSVCVLAFGAILLLADAFPFDNTSTFSWPCCSLLCSTPCHSVHIEEVESCGSHLNRLHCASGLSALLLTLQIWTFDGRYWCD